MTASPIPAADLETARARLVRVYGSERNATLRTLYACLNLTLLLTFAWPALVVFFDAPVVSAANTPADWFALRLAAPLIVLAVAIRIWWASGVPGMVARPERAVRLLAGEGILPQLYIFLIGLTLVLIAILVLSDARAAAKVLALGLCEALAVQVIISGYVKSSLEVLEADPQRAFWTCAALFAVVFGLRGALAAAIQPDAGPGFVLAAGLALVAAGLLLGVAFVYLRDRTSTLLPATLLHWLLIAIVPAAAG